jgi:SecD/SecF fusion protein
MREELQRGAALRMAIRNGFDKALSAIVDGNLTTFLTALVLYFIGTDQVKGFGITLMLGNVTSMFTAIFVARVILDVSERTRFIKTLSMASFLTKPSIDWVRFFGPATVGSLVLILIGLVATVARGKGLFDIDLAGGTSVTFLLKSPTPEATVRKKLDAIFEGMKDPVTNTQVDHNVYGMTVNTQDPDTVYKVDSSLEDIALLQQKVREALRLENGEDGLKTFQLEVGPLSDAPVETPKSTPTIGAPGLDKGKEKDQGDTSKASPAIGAKTPPESKTEAESKKASEEKAAEPTSKTEPEPKKAPEEKAAEPSGKKANEEAKPGDAPGEAADCGIESAEQEATKTQPDDSAKKADPPAAEPAKTEPAADEKTKAPAAPSAAAPASAAQATDPAPSDTPTPAAPKARTKTQVKFPGSPINGETLKRRLASVAKSTIGQDIDVEVSHPDWDGLDNSTFEEWTVILPLDQEQAGKVLAAAEKQLEGEVVWQTSNKIGGQVSADTRWRAVGALAVSLLGIVAYVWFRFQQVAWGLAAVAALAHDALVMLTGIALSYWFASSLGIIGVEEFKISLPVVAAFLAILGYSVNDTIVIFDRLREIRGKSPTVTRAMLNEAVNQTLSRNIILAGITVTVVFILYGFGGPGIHAFAFAMVIGVLSGCYTTLVIAAPMLLWLLNRKAIQAVGGAVEKREVTPAA